MTCHRLSLRQRTKKEYDVQHRRDPGEDLDTGWNRNDHGRQGEVGLNIGRHTNGIHVVSPDNEAYEADRHHGVGHAQVTEDRLAGERADHVADDTESRQDHDVNFGVTEEPKQVLEQDRVAAFGAEETGAKRVICQQHSDGTAENRYGQKQQEGRNQHGPGKQWHAVQGHARCTHVQDRGDEVYRPHNGRRTGHVQGKNRKRNRHFVRLHD